MAPINIHGVSVKFGKCNKLLLTHCNLSLSSYRDIIKHKISGIRPFKRYNMWLLLLNTLFLPSNEQTSIKSGFQSSDQETTDHQLSVTALCIIYVTLSSLANSNCSLGKYH